jgi:pimeloyl-ACP methyl ester carboxylesterase
MKKWLKITLVIIAAIVGLAYFVGLPMMTKKAAHDILVYKKMTFDQVLSDSIMKTEHYYIGDERSPEDYGYDSVETISFNSVYDEEVKLEGWYVHSAVSDTAPCVIISHGRTSNRLKTLKFVKMFKDLGLHENYNFFIPDYRNSGNASSAPTQLGNKFAEDLTASLLKINDKYGTKDFILYSFSMGALATADFMWRSDLQAKTASKNIEIQKMIFDSPLSNVPGVIEVGSKKMGAYDFMVDDILENLSDEIRLPNGEEVFDKMRFSVLLKDVKQPILMLQSEDDIATPAVFLKEELGLLDSENIKVVYFDNPSKAEFTHVRLYIHHTEQYENLVKEFLEKK